ncbi:MAG: DUF58 domain-containing protein [Anaerolineales bacterium]
MKIHPHIKLRSALLPILTLLVLIVEIFTPYRGWRMLFAGLGGAWLLSTFWAWELEQHLQLRREMRFGWAQVGDRLVERFTLINDAWAPAVWVEVVDQSTMPEYHVSRGIGLGMRDAIRWHDEAVCQRRGLFTLGPTRLRTGDPLGVYSVELDYPAAMPLLVLPPIVPLPAIEVASGGRTGQGRLRVGAVERTVSASSVREYVPGDSRRWIHWRLSAHHDELYVREFDGMPSADWWIVLDMDRYVQAGTGLDATQEHGVILAASLADRGIRQRRSVGLVAQGEELVWIAPDEGEGHRWEILRALATVSLGAHSLHEVLTRIQPDLGQRTSLIIITPSLDPHWVEALIPLMQRGVVPTVLLIDPSTFAEDKKYSAEVEALLVELGIAYYPIEREMLDRPESRPGEQGQWEWRVLGTGKVIPIRKPESTNWKVLS